MAEYVVFDPRSEVSGKSILIISSAVKALGGDITPYLERHGLAGVQPDEWYKLQACLDMLKDIAHGEQSFFSMVSMGNQTPDFFPWPPQVTMVEQAFAGLDMQYHTAHRNGDVGDYSVEDAAPRHLVVTARNPWPSDFDFGLCWGLVRRFAPDKGSVLVVRRDSPCRLHGDDRCVYDVTW